jgi:hypothetical protein
MTKSQQEIADMIADTLFLLRAGALKEPKKGSK